MAVIMPIKFDELFDFKPRTCTHICASWVKDGFLEIVDSSNKGRKYKLASQYEHLMLGK